MKKKMENKSLIYLLSMPLFLGPGFRNILELGKQDVWISCFLGIIIGMFINHLILKRENNNKYINIFCNIVLLGIVTMTITKLIANLYLPLTPEIIISLCFIVVCLYAVFKSRNSFIKICEITFIISVVLHLINLLVLVPSLKIDYFLPIGTSNLSDIIKAAFIFAIFTSCPFITINKFSEVYNTKVYVFSSLLIAFIFVDVVGILGSNLALLYRYPEYIVLKRISILDFIENFENILYSIWLIDSFAFGTNTCINIKKNSNVFVLIGAIIIMFILNHFLVLNKLIKSINFINWYSYIVLFILCLWLLTSKKKKPKEINP